MVYKKAQIPYLICSYYMTALSQEYSGELIQSSAIGTGQRVPLHRLLTQPHQRAPGDQQREQVTEGH